MSEKRLEMFGPISIPCDVDGKKKCILDQNVKEFWNDTIAQQMEKKQGCYIFALKAGHGYTPWYIGKTTKTFKQESFALHKIKKYNECLWGGKKGTPVMFFIALPGHRNKVPALVIKDIEKFLIQSAALKNPNILNSHHTKNLPQ